ncbi:patatin-like phospholipase family protein [Qipengyuania sp. XHP0211]|uniref:patatin-like phospholipase family protein n=1 Tax=Qipengyuania sp. XHP0211 TaxID=3038079 RepID=UPI00241FD270|nr:patatin-like phospholipase family protein [Qipengyuania sp. XHP0211]MDG5751911.1 patatin-like phospholipase family protein [Qipengyuania sp. XHP0211]
MIDILICIGAVLLSVAVILAIAFRIVRRGALTFEIDGFYTHVMDGDPGPIIRDVQRDATAALECKLDDPMSCSIKEAVECHVEAEAPECNVLLLSGGGQWGAFGAGLFKRLSEQSGPKELGLEGIGVITGISTGSLQALMLMVALDPKQSPVMRRHALDRLVWGYSPEKESEVVRHTGLALVPFFGSAAGTAPLRKRIIEALCPGGDCKLVEAIGKSSIAGYAGFVEADDGSFRYADLRELVNKAPSLEKAAEALAAATMASSAMPVFHQQLRVAGSDGKAVSLYDGGVRRSVFFDRTMAIVDRQVRKEMASHGVTKASTISQESFAAEYRKTAPKVYVVRNGPTVRKPAPELNRKSGPLKNGQRGYDLLVNESEIGAIAALRLGNPYGEILLTTADMYDTFPSTVGENFKDDEMFKPAFMARLRDLGRFKADRKDGPWWELSRLET